MERLFIGCVVTSSRDFHKFRVSTPSFNTFFKSCKNKGWKERPNAIELLDFDIITPVGVGNKSQKLFKELAKGVESVKAEWDLQQRFDGSLHYGDYPDKQWMKISSDFKA